MQVYYKMMKTQQESFGCSKVYEVQIYVKTAIDKGLQTGICEINMLLSQEEMNSTHF